MKSFFKKSEKSDQRELKTMSDYPQIKNPFSDISDLEFMDLTLDEFDQKLYNLYVKAGLLLPKEGENNATSN